jgi:hypothetical protein
VPIVGSCALNVPWGERRGCGDTASPEPLVGRPRRHRRRPAAGRGWRLQRVAGRALRVRDRPAAHPSPAPRQPEGAGRGDRTGVPTRTSPLHSGERGGIDARRMARPNRTRHCVGATTDSMEGRHRSCAGLASRVLLVVAALSGDVAVSRSRRLFQSGPLRDTQPEARAGLCVAGRDRPREAFPVSSTAVSLCRGDAHEGGHAPEVAGTGREWTNPSARNVAYTVFVSAAIWSLADSVALFRPMARTSPESGK